MTVLCQLVVLGLGAGFLLASLLAVVDAARNIICAVRAPTR